MDNIFVSIIVPCYNSEMTVAICIDSVTTQSHKKLELIIINDGSNDLTESIIKEKVNIDKRIKLINIANSGAAAARNIGIRSSAGEYLIFLDADDFLEPNAVEMALTSIISYGSEVHCFGYRFIGSKNKPIKGRMYSTKKLPRPKKYPEDALFDINILSVPWNKIYKKEFLISNEIFFPEIRANEDMVFSRHLSLMAKNISFSNDVLYNAVVREGSVSRTPSKQHIRATLEGVAEVNKLYSAAKYEPAIHLAGYKNKVMIRIIYDAALYSSNYESFKVFYLEVLYFGEVDSVVLFNSPVSAFYKVFGLLIGFPRLIFYSSRLFNKIIRN